MSTKVISIIVIIIIIAAAIWAAMNFSTNNVPNGQDQTEQQEDVQDTSNILKAITGRVDVVNNDEIMFKAGPYEYKALVSGKTSYYKLNAQGQEELIISSEIVKGSIIQVFYYSEPEPNVYEAEKIYKRN